MRYLALLVELHHPLPGPGAPVGPDWTEAAVEVYWPLLRVVSELVEDRAQSTLTLAISPGWTALAGDAGARRRVRAELERRADASASARSLRRFVVDRWAEDLLGPVRHAAAAGAVELIPTTASQTWLPSVASDPVTARAQVLLAAADHAQVFGARPSGLWLPFLAYAPQLESILAEGGLRYFGVRRAEFLRGSVLPPDDVFGPLITPPGVAAFGISPEPAHGLTDPARRYARDPRYADGARADAAAADHASHFLARWRELAEACEGSRRPGAISVAAVSVHDLGGGWSHGPAWLGEVVRRLARLGDWTPITPGRYLDRHPEGTVGRPGPSAGGLLSVRPGGTDLLDRCRVAADALAVALDRRGSLGPLGRRALAQMARSLLQAQQLDWHLPPGRGIPVETALDRADRHLARFYELAGSLAARRLDPARLAALEAGPAYLPEIDPELLALG
jgi:1,4-alpha-glucan branching enzyme